MATIPPNSMQPSAEPGAAPAEGMEPEAQGGYTVCIQVGPTGELSVGVQRGSYAAEDGDTPFTPAATRKEALTLALELLQNGGNPPEPEDDSAFDEGFASRGQPA